MPLSNLTQGPVLYNNCCIRAPFSSLYLERRAIGVVALQLLLSILVLLRQFVSEFAALGCLRSHFGALGEVNGCREMKTIQYMS